MAKKRGPTGTNVYALAEFVVQDGYFTPTSRRHLTRCIEFGLLKVSGTKAKVTAAGVKAIAADDWHIVNRIAMSILPNKRSFTMKPVRNVPASSSTRQHPMMLARRRNPRIPKTPKTKAGYFKELVEQVYEWMFMLTPPQPLLASYFKRVDLAQTVKTLATTPSDREYLIVEFDVLPAILIQAAEQGLTRAQMKRLVNQITREIMPYLSGDPDDWWLEYQLPMLRDKGVIDETTVQGAQMAWLRFLNQ